MLLYLLHRGCGWPSKIEPVSHKSWWWSCGGRLVAGLSCRLDAVRVRSSPFGGRWCYTSARRSCDLSICSLLTVRIRMSEGTGSPVHTFRLTGPALSASSDSRSGMIQCWIEEVVKLVSSKLCKNSCQIACAIDNVYPPKVWLTLNLKSGVQAWRLPDEPHC